jgi:protein-S-isoprenylcysteine O-methyltransferase Ste14
VQERIPRWGPWLVTGQGIGAIALILAWWRFPAEGWPLAALGAIALGGTVAGAAFLALGSAFRVGPTPRPGARLVRSGIYRWLRHPMYVGAQLVVAAAAISRPSMPVLVVASLNFAWYFLKARYEERLLAAHYADYDHYRRDSLGLGTAAPRDGDDR